MICVAEKKSASRFCIQFNTNDTHHQQVIDILNAQGRHKAQYIATAILHYINCRETPAIPQDDTRFRQTIEAVVLEILEKHSETSAKQFPLGTAKTPPPKMRRPSEANMEQLDDETLDAIRDSLATFRSLDT